MKYALIPLRGAIDSNAMTRFLLLDLVNVIWGIQWCACVCACVRVRARSAYLRHDWFDLTHFGLVCTLLFPLHGSEK